MKETPQLIGIEGKWYDITHFAHVHPGGEDILKNLIGQDVTSVFRALHPPHAEARLKMLKQYGTYEWTPTPFDELESEIRRDGLYETNYSWYIGRVIIIGIFFISILFSGTLGLGRIATGILVFLFWQQCGFMLHDLKHSQVTHNRFWDGLLGTFFGTFCFGMSSEYWRREHFLHHVFTNAFVKENVFLPLDDQMYQTIWAQHASLVPFLNSYVKRFLLPIQHFLWMPICVFAGRINLMISSMVKETSIDQWIAFIGHLFCTICLLSSYALFDALVIYSIAATAQGILHLQLIVNHYTKHWHERSEMWEIDSKHGWHVRQMLTTSNVISYKWLDWFFGGLNFHIEHHFFPRLAQNRLRDVQPRVLEVCKKNGITHLYEQRSFIDLIALTIKNMGEIAKGKI